jgi:hypothetical protein
MRGVKGRIATLSQPSVSSLGSTKPHSLTPHRWTCMQAPLPSDMHCHAGAGIRPSSTRRAGALVVRPAFKRAPQHEQHVQAQQSTFAKRSAPQPPLAALAPWAERLPPGAELPPLFLAGESCTLLHCNASLLAASVCLCASSTHVQPTSSTTCHPLTLYCCETGAPGAAPRQPALAHLLPNAAGLVSTKPPRCPPLFLPAPAARSDGLLPVREEDRLLALKENRSINTPLQTAAPAGSVGCAGSGMTTPLQGPHSAAAGQHLDAPERRAQQAAVPEWKLQQADSASATFFEREKMLLQIFG